MLTDDFDLYYDFKFLENNIMEYNTTQRRIRFEKQTFISDTFYSTYHLQCLVRKKA